MRLPLPGGSKKFDLPAVSLPLYISAVSRLPLSLCCFLSPSISMLFPVSLYLYAVSRLTLSLCCFPSHSISMLFPVSLYLFAVSRLTLSLCCFPSPSISLLFPSPLYLCNFIVCPLKRNEGVFSSGYIF